MPNNLYVRTNYKYINRGRVKISNSIFVDCSSTENGGAINIGSNYLANISFVHFFHAKQLK